MLQKHVFPILLLVSALVLGLGCKTTVKGP